MRSFATILGILALLMLLPSAQPASAQIPQYLENHPSVRAGLTLPVAQPRHTEQYTYRAPEPRLPYPYPICPTPTFTPKRAPLPGCYCIEIYDPVCGVDGHTYGNACTAHCQSTPIAYRGECKPSLPAWCYPNIPFDPTPYPPIVFYEPTPPSQAPRRHPNLPISSRCSNNSILPPRNPISGNPCFQIDNIGISDLLSRLRRLAY